MGFSRIVGLLELAGAVHVVNRLPPKCPDINAM